jgi:hypothetical protein
MLAPAFTPAVVGAIDVDVQQRLLLDLAMTLRFTPVFSAL